MQMRFSIRGRRDRAGRHYFEERDIDNEQEGNTGDPQAVHSEKLCDHENLRLLCGPRLPEEEAFKYFDIFKKTLSGTVGKNMLNMEFPLDAEMPGGTQEFLLKLRNSKLEDDGRYAPRRVL